jgi:prepilin-type N-terminal cleavage/methylation domain-containing protein
MTNSTLKNKNGLTLVEVIITTAIIGMIIAVVFSLFSFGNKTFYMSNSQYDIQSEVRFATDIIIKDLRFATSLEILSVDLIKDSNLQEEGFSYFYISDGKLYNVIYDEVADSHNTVIYGRNLDSNLSMFTQVDSSTLGIAVFSQHKNQTYNIKTEIILLNLKYSKNSITGSNDLGLKYKRRIPSPL